MQRLLLCLCLFVAIELPCRAQGEKPQPNTLTAKEIADGWLLLYDGKSNFGWKARAEQQYLKPFGNTLDMGATMNGVFHTVPFGAFELTFEYASSSKASVGIRSPDGESREFVTFGKTNQLTPMSIRVANETVTFEGPKIKSTKPWKNTAIVWFDPSGNMKIQNVKLRPLETKSIFNGKDLTGWKTFPGDKYKSKFSVNDKGELNVKDGPGDLQTVGKYRDFVLQLECISNGTHLNSGIFFRCRDGEYQNGYEAQIRNQFTKEATQKYVVEEYDPKTNMLLAKKDVMSTAFDYGTGAIYRRVPARKEMSKDNEWFAMTIVAHGNHLATWVNGVQVTNWSDHRAKSDNARTGQKLDAGHISIQGHDPTTDLSFRNFRLAELK